MDSPFQDLQAWLVAHGSASAVERSVEVKLNFPMLETSEIVYYQYCMLVEMGSTDDEWSRHLLLV